VPGRAAATVSAVPESPWILRADDVSFAYSVDTKALDGLDLEVRKGEVVGIVGPSGCGKSTLLSLLAGVKDPQSGTVAWNTTRTRDRAPGTQRELTLVFQQDTVLPWLTVESNVGLGLRYLDLPKREKQERVTELLSLANLSQVRRAYPYQLSGGMKRRVAFLTGVAPYPEVLLLDEPFSSVDEPTRVAIHRDILKIIYALEMSVVLVTHDLGEAISLSDVVYILTQRPARIASRYETPFDRERDLLRVRETESYQSLYRVLWHDLAREIERSER
jgi:ABC-type nitrate/sulfonate/bicarbonate transport system ATPase subunit